MGLELKPHHEGSMQQMQGSCVGRAMLDFLERRICPMGRLKICAIAGALLSRTLSRRGELPQPIMLMQGSIGCCLDTTATGFRHSTMKIGHVPRVCRLLGKGAKFTTHVKREWMRLFADVHLCNGQISMPCGTEFPHGCSWLCAERLNFFKAGLIQVERRMRWVGSVTVGSNFLIAT